MKLRFKVEFSSEEERNHRLVKTVHVKNEKLQKSVVLELTDNWLVWYMAVISQYKIIKFILAIERIFVAVHFLSSFHQTVLDANCWTIPTLFIAISTDTSCFEIFVLLLSSFQ